MKPAAHRRLGHSLMELSVRNGDQKWARTSRLTPDTRYR